MVANTSKQKTSNTKCLDQASIVNMQESWNGKFMQSEHYKCIDDNKKKVNAELQTEKKYITPVTSVLLK